jgi:hypothetical protein
MFTTTACCNYRPGFFWRIRTSNYTLTRSGRGRCNRPVSPQEFQLALALALAPALAHAIVAVAGAVVEASQWCSLLVVVVAVAGHAWIGMLSICGGLWCVRPLLCSWCCAVRCFALHFVGVI